MAEVLAVLGVVSTVVGVAINIKQFVDFGSTVISRLKQFQDRQNELPEAFRDISYRLPLLVDSLARTGDQIAKGELRQQTQDALVPVVDGCLEQTKLLKRILDKVLPAEDDSTVKRCFKTFKTVKRSFKAFKSIFQDKRVEQISVELGKYVAVLTLHHVTPGYGSCSGTVNVPEVQPEVKQYYKVPNRRVRGFVGRQDVLARIEQGFSSGSRPRIVVLRGMGGQGKTQVALEYCHQMKSKGCSAIFWVDATSERTLKQSFESIWDLVKSPRNVLQDTDARVDFVLETFANWPRSWLMVFDNYDDLEGFDNCSDFIPRGEEGAILVTTRNAGVDELGYAIELLGLQERDALDLLFKGSTIEKTDHEIEHGKKIVERLGYHPLATAQASAYISKRKINFSEFMVHYDRRRRLILQETIPMTQYKRKLNDREKETALSVFTTWELSFQQLEVEEREGNGKAYILTLLAFFECKDINENLFKAYCNDRKSNNDASKIQGCLDLFIADNMDGWDSDLFRDVFSDLRLLSLVQAFEPGVDGFYHLSLHPLVKDWIKLRTDTKTCEEYTFMAAKIVAKLLETCRHNSQFVMSLSAQQEVTSHIHAHIQNYKDFLSPNAAKPLSRFVCEELNSVEDWFADFFMDSGRYIEAEEIIRRVLEERVLEKALGKEHPHTLISMNKLAGVLNMQGKYEEAKEMNKLTLQLREKVLGKEHPYTLSSINNLASVLDNQGKYVESEKMHRLTFQLKEKVLGKEHPSTLSSMSNLALVLDSQGKYEESEKMHQMTLQLREKVLGKEHPHTLVSINNMALVLERQGKFEKAEEMSRLALQLTENVLGKEHPQTLSSINNLASVLDSQGKYEEAEHMYKLTLQLREKVLGKEHPNTLVSMNNLAFVLLNQSKFEEAEKMNRLTLQVREKVLGKEHPHTLSSINNLASILKKQGKFEEAEEMHRCTLQLREKLLGKEHPQTISSINNLASVLNSQGKYEEAEEMHQLALQLSKKVLGKEHPDTLVSMNNLALVLQNQGKFEEAEEMNRLTLLLIEKVLGKEHPHTLISMTNLVSVLKSQGKFEEAKEMNQLILQLRGNVLGKKHP